MKTLIVYYSRSGTTRVVARALAKDLPADIEEIHCNRYARGFSNYLLAVYESWKGKRPRIDPLAHALSEYELVVIAGPIWAFRPATPLRTFLTQERIRLRRVAFLLTHGGTAGDRSLGEMRTDQRPCAGRDARRAREGREGQQVRCCPLLVRGRAKEIWKRPSDGAASLEAMWVRLLRPSNALTAGLCMKLALFLPLDCGRMRGRF